MEYTVSYHCPNCDAGLRFDAEKQRFVCDFCMSEFSKEELDKTESAKAAEQKAEDREREDEKNAGRYEEENKAFREGIHGYNCPSCGAEVICEVSTAAQFCAYCHNPVVLSDKLSGVWKPAKVIPFKLNREAALKKLTDYLKKKKFIPSDFLTDSTLEKMTGIYYPFWVTDADTKAQYTGVGRRVRTWVSGNYRYTETSRFAVRRAGDIHFEDIVLSATTEDDRKMLEGVLPYPSDVYEDFSMAYLSGFFAKKRNIDKETQWPEVRNRMSGYARTLLGNTVNGYAGVEGVNTSLEVKNSATEYSLSPVWVLTYKDKKGKPFRFAINGYTGKLYGELPVSVPKLFIMLGVVLGSAILIALLILLISGGLF